MLKQDTADSKLEVHLTVVAQAVLFGDGNADAVWCKRSEFHGHQVASRLSGALRDIPLHHPHTPANDVPCTAPQSSSTEVTFLSTMPLVLGGMTDAADPLDRCCCNG